jgi:hypothetical protein
VGWDDADLTELELLQKGVEHRRVAVVNGIERTAEDHDGTRRVGHWDERVRGFERRRDAARV